MNLSYDILFFIWLSTLLTSSSIVVNHLETLTESFASFYILEVFFFSVSFNFWCMFCMGLEIAERLLISSHCCYWFSFFDAQAMLFFRCFYRVWNIRFVYIPWSEGNQEEDGNWQIQLNGSVGVSCWCNCWFAVNGFMDRIKIGKWKHVMNRFIMGRAGHHLTTD